MRTIGHITPDMTLSAHEKARERELDQLDREVENLLREFTVWAIISQHGASLTQANRIVDGGGLWPDNEPSSDSMIKRSIRVLKMLR